MKKVWEALGVMTFWLTWPGLWLMLRWSHRTRLLLVCKGEFLVLRGWINSGEWGLPGGGLHKAENAVDGLLREVQEETGLVLLSNQVQPAFDGVYRQHGFQFQYHSFIAHLDTKPELRLRSREITAYAWQPLENPALPLTQDTKVVLEWWLRRV